MTILTREQVEQIVTGFRVKRERLDLIDVDLRGIDLSKMDLSGAKLYRANLNGTNLKEASLTGANLTEASLSLANLDRVDLSRANLSRTNFTRANLNGANLIWANLSWANFTEADLGKVDLVCAKLSEANLSGAKLNRARLDWANLNGANLIRADLTGANLNRTKLRRTNLSGTVLNEAGFSGADLNQVDLTKAEIRYTSFLDVDLSTVKGLDSVVHSGPSYIDVHTFQQSKGKIPESFLRGAGISDIFITYITSLTNEAIQYYSCFISYSHNDEDFAQRLHTDLQDKGVRCWFAPEDMKVGDKIRLAIDQSIRIHDKLLLILSNHSINSTWVEKEVETAFEEETKRKQTVFFPVRLDDAVMETDQAWAADIRRTRHIGNFSRWKDHDAYQQAFERLLRDLKAEG